MRFQRAVLIVLFVASASAAAEQPVVPCSILVPVLDASKAVVTATAPDGKAYPVFRPAPASTLTEKARRELDASFAQRVLRLDRYARNLLVSRRAATHTPVEEWLTAPMYLLMSTEEGGFARFGFWLQDPAGSRRLVLAGYVDLVVTNNSIETGSFEEIFPHELAHLILKALTGGLGNGPSRKMHQSMTVTDYPTAFDEGYAEHFQPLARDASDNTYLRKLASGIGATDFELLWLSATDNQLRTDGVKRNLFIHRKPLPASALDPKTDPYRLFMEEETSTSFLPAELKNGQEMMASEGVIATLFYRIVNDKQLREHYRDAHFYQPFLRHDFERPEQAVTPYENVNLKLFVAMERLRGAEPDSPLMLNLIEQYAKLFPDEAQRIYTIFIETTWGATVSHQLASELERTATDGGRGDLTAFRKDHPFPLLDSTISQAVAGKQTLGADLGAQIWVANTEFRIALSAWGTERNQILTINLNTATVSELMTIRGVDLPLALEIIRERRARGVFHSIRDLQALAVPTEVIERLNRMQAALKDLGQHKRE